MKIVINKLVSTKTIVPITRREVTVGREQIGVRIKGIGALESFSKKFLFRDQYVVFHSQKKSEFIIGPN